MNKLTKKKIDSILELHNKQYDMSSAKIAEQLGLSVTAVYRYRPKRTIFVECKNPMCHNQFKYEGYKKYCSYKCRPSGREYSYKKLVPNKQARKELAIKTANQKLKDIWK